MKLQRFNSQAKTFLHVIHTHTKWLMEILLRCRLFNLKFSNKNHFSGWVNMDLSRTLARSPLILWPKRHLWKTVLYVLLMTAWTQESTADTTPLNSTSPSQVYYPIETQNYFEWKIFKVSRIVPFWTKKNSTYFGKTKYGP